MRVAERLSTIAATATITSAAWILFGSVWLNRPAPAAPQLAAPPLAASGAGGAERVAAAPVIQPGKAGLVIPVAGVKAEQLTDNFSDARGGGSRLHEALDIMAPRGTPVVAAAAGTVEKLFHSDAGGNTIYVRTPDRNTIHYYAHLDRYADGLVEGAPLRRGEVIGYVGTTGNAPANTPHLHFAIARGTPSKSWWKGEPVNPYLLLRP